MTAHQQPSNLQDQLVSMGFNQSDIARAIQAGMNDINQVIEYIAENPVDERKNLTLDAKGFPALQPTNTNTIGTTSNPSDSLDVINLNSNRAPSTSPETKTVSNVQKSSTKSDDNLKEVIEISRREAEERETVKAMQLSMTEVSNKTEAQQVAQAMRLSVQENQSTFDNEQDQDILRAMEESLKDNTKTNPNRSVSWQSGPSSVPKNRLRSDINQPVGLRNIGNTCYLNSLLQVYFHLSNFRRAIMAFRATHDFEKQFLDSQSQEITEYSSKPTPTPHDSFPDLEFQNQEDNRPHVNEIEKWPEQEEQPVQAPEPKEEEEEEKSSAVPFLDTVEKREAEAVIFVIELQRLFAAMALGNENCVDPTAVAKAMRDSDGNPIKIGAQQDASEFNHLFLDIVERAFQSQRYCEYSNQSSRETLDENSMQDESSDMRDQADMDTLTRENIVKDLFTIKFQQEISRSTEQTLPTGTEDTNPLKSDGETNCLIVDATSPTYRDLHSGLQDYTYTKIESVDGSPRVSSTAVQITEDQSSPSSEKHDENNNQLEIGSTSNNMMKRVWFTSLPPIIVIHLQRVKYNRTIAKAEKVCDRYDFASAVAFDRYLQMNRNESLSAMNRVLAMRAEKSRLEYLCHQIEDFPVNKNQDEVKNEIENPFSKTVQQTFDGAMKGVISSNTRNESMFKSFFRVQARLKEALKPSSDMFAIHDISQTQVKSTLDLLDVLLKHDQQSFNGLMNKLNNLETEDHIYRDLSSVLYHLHAVLVHDGAPSSGHYWTFIRNWSSTEEARKWMKLSDSMLSYVSEEEMFQWSLGGHGRASAYCLMYTTTSLSAEDENGNSQSIAEESKRLLSETRISEVKEQSDKLVQQLEASN